MNFVTGNKRGIRSKMTKKKNVKKEKKKRENFIKRRRKMTFLERVWYEIDAKRRLGLHKKT